MQISAIAQSARTSDPDTIAIGVFDGEGPPPQSPPQVGELLESGEARRSFKSLALAHAGGQRWLVVGLGARPDFNAERARGGGGISLKPGAKMAEMKFDMSGGAAVIEAVSAIARLKLPVKLVAVVGATENLPSGRSIKPGDIVTFAGLMSNDDELAARIADAGERSGEIVWRLPLHAEYDELIKGKYGDLDNASEGRKAGTIVGGAFLSNFVGQTPWAHLDIAGSAWELDRAYVGKGASGYGVRLLVELAKAYCS